MNYLLRFALILFLVLPPQFAWGSRDCDGTDDDIQVVDDAQLDITGDLTFALWVYFDGTPNDAWHTIVSKRTATPQANYGMNFNPTGGTDIIQLFYTDVSNNFQVESETFTTNFSADTWYHLAGTLDDTGGSTTATIYKDGAVLGTATSGLTNTPAANTGVLAFCFEAASSSEYASIRIAEFKLWDVILSVGEVKSAMACENVRTDSLRSHPPFWALSTTEADLSGNVNNGTVTGAVSADHPPCGPYR